MCHTSRAFYAAYLYVMRRINAVVYYLTATKVAHVLLIFSPSPDTRAKLFCAHEFVRYDMHPKNSLYNILSYPIKINTTPGIKRVILVVYLT